MNNFQNAYHYGPMNYSGYHPNYVGNPPYNYQTSYPSPSELLVYGPYQEGPASQTFPPDWFGYYEQTNPYIPSNVPDIAYYMNPQFLPQPQRYRAVRPSLGRHR